MALNDESPWLQTQGGGGLTPKQTDMQNSMYPGAFTPSAPKPKEDSEGLTSATSTGAQRARETAGQEQKAQAPRQQTPQDQQLQQQVANLSAKIGSFGYLLKSKVNQFLTSANSAGVSSGPQSTTFDANTGTMSVTDSLQTSIDPAVQQKTGLQEQLNSVLSPFAKKVAGTLQGKTFDDALQDMAKTDPEMAKALPQILQVSQMLEQIESQGGANSPEANSLRQQLEQMDNTGFVAGLKKAKDQYESLMGISKNPLTYSGDTTQKYSALNLASLSQEDLRKEVQDAIVSGSGLFGGDTNENLKKLYDTESAEITNANRQKEALHAQLATTLADYAETQGHDFETAREKINQTFTDASNQILSSLQSSGDNRAAVLWMQALKGQPLDKVLYQALNDPNSGLALSQRQAIQNFIGAAGTSEGGELAGWVNSLRSTGKIAVKGADGNYTNVSLTPGQTTEILEAMKDPAVVDKGEKIQEIVERSAVNGTTIGELVNNAVTQATTMGNTPQAVKAFQDSMVASMQSYAKSKTENVVREAMGIQDADWAKLDDKAKQDLVVKTFAEKPELVKALRENITVKSADDKVATKTAIDDFNKRYDASKASVDKLATFDAKGNLVGGEYSQLKSRMSPETVYSTIAGNAVKQFNATIKDPQRFNQYYQEAVKNPALKEAGIDPVILAKAQMFYDNYKDMMRYSPTLAEAYYGGPGIMAGITPLQMAQMGDIAGLRAINAGTEKASQEIGTTAGPMIYQDMKNANPNSPLYAQIQAELGKNADAMKKLDAEIEKARRFGTDLAGAKEAIDLMSKQDLEKIYDPDQILNVAMGGARGIEQNGTANVAGLQKDNPDMASNIQTINGVPYLKLGDGTYRPFTAEDMTAAVGKASTFMGAKPIVNSTDIVGQKLAGPGKDIAGFASAPTTQKVKTMVKDPNGVSREVTHEVTLPSVYYVTHFDGTTTPVVVPPGGDLNAVMAKMVPSGDVKDIRRETVSERISQVASSLASTVGGLFSAAYGWMTKTGPNTYTATVDGEEMTIDFSKPVGQTSAGVQPVGGTSSSDYNYASSGGRAGESGTETEAMSGR